MFFKIGLKIFINEFNYTISSSSIRMKIETALAEIGSEAVVHIAMLAP